MSKVLNKPHTNKLSIYLIKSDYDEDKDILKNFDKLKKEELKKIGNFYYDFIS